MVSIVLTWLPGWIISPSQASARTKCGSYHWQLASPQQPVGTHAFSRLRGKEVAAWTSKHSAGVCQHCGGPTGDSAVKESACQCRRYGFHPWIRKIPWKRKWQATPVFLLGKSRGQRSLAGYIAHGASKSQIRLKTLNSSNNITILPPSNPGSGVAAGVGREEPRSQPHLTRWPISLPACRQHQPPASDTQDMQRLPDDCWLLIRSMSSLRPAGKWPGSL